MSDQTVAASTHDADAAHLAELGINSEFKEGDEPVGELRPRVHLSLTRRRHLHGVRIRSRHCRPADRFWSLLIVGLGQLMVAPTFSEVVAQFPVAGGVTRGPAACGA